ncbi:MAG: ATP-binding cassette domain-containing protein, partial [Lachnospiraceae bacterium]|nr:ATP-binding cassette domain-containing protein [Lachnospiraceae bacterium]
QSVPKPSIRFQHVSFSYQPGQPVLEDVSFAIHPGECATLTGRTGAGKSTIFRLLLGLFQPDAGHITICGRNPMTIPDSQKRKLFGYVEQSFHLIPGTIAEQISLFDPSISRAQIEQAARLTGLHEIILALENGYDTPAAENLFSQGQLQLLSIARAIAADPEILLLDEITANLDSDTERRVMDALEQASRNRTVLSISHRLYERTMAGKLISVGKE